ncbi:sensor domain-containing diguanylate cyclase [Thauera sp. 63]|uniref:sensor domain-containing diguanylate cyclase n=1 Tax=Thauera sp. 63 TaxID=497321 RepID=UPI0002D03A96|nr:diguanylate cyclase [Thauera sp. 63]ENO74634.1 periplasmic/7TM domain sensor diguanylate cyclase [Thauera sp. 63]
MGACRGTVRAIARDAAPSHARAPGAGTPYRLLLLGFFLVLAALAQAGSADAADPRAPRLAMLLEDGGPALGAEQAFALQREGRFRDLPAGVPKFGIGAPPVWFHFAVDHAGSGPLLRQLLAGVPWIERLEVFVLQDGQLRAVQRAGDGEAGLRGPMGSLGFAFDLAFAPGHSDVLIRAQTADPLVMPLRLLPPDEAIELQRRHDYGFGLLYGFLLALIAYNAMIFIGLRHRSHLDYVLYVGTFLLLSLAYSGHGVARFWPGQAGFQQYVILMLMVLLAAMGLRFASGFLHLETIVPRAHRGVRGFYLAALLAIGACTLFGLQSAAVFTAFFVVQVFSVLMCLLGVVGLRARQDGAPYFMAGAVSGMLGASVTAMAVWRGMPFTELTFRAAELGFAVDGTILALALADRMRRIREQQLRAEHLAAFDPLTGLRNRRAFAEHAAPVWSTARRHGRPLSVIVLDLDHFKRINDSHGHAIGDTVLVAAARAIERDCRAGDIAARWGGEEFIVLMPETTGQQAWAMAERLLASVRSIDIPLGGERLGVSASVGVAEWRGHDDLEALIREADAWMYASKRAGRDRVSGSSPAADRAYAG